MQFPIAEIATGDISLNADTVHHLRREGRFHLAHELAITSFQSHINTFLEDTDKKFPEIENDDINWICSHLDYQIHFLHKYKELTSAIDTLHHEYKGGSNREFSFHLHILNDRIRVRYEDYVPLALAKLISRLFQSHCGHENVGFISKFNELVDYIRTLKWNIFYRDVISKSLEDQIASHIQTECFEDYIEPKLELIRNWFNLKISSFLNILFDTHPNEKEKLLNILEDKLFSEFAKLRAKQLFEIVGEYPDTKNTLKEIKESVSKSCATTLSYLGKIFRNILRKRLLHSGAETRQILEMYILVIRALRVVDPSDLLLTYVAQPIREYLMRRSDTVRCTMAMTAEGGSELHSELRKGGSLECLADEDDEEGGPGAAWEPAIRDAQLSDGDGSSERGLDILALLVSIYGSTAVFVTEFRTLLADKLLASLDYFTDAEIANLELLKLRFGDDSLHSCDVMLRDVEDSRRINTTIANEFRKQPQLLQARSGSISEAAIDCTLISDNYWPSIRNSDAAVAVLHPAANQLLVQYEAVYAKQRVQRKLKPLHQHGRVELELEFDDGVSRTFLVTPIQASLILHFHEDSVAVSPAKISLASLAAQSELPDAAVTKAMSYWVSRGVVRESKSVSGEIIYEAVEEQPIASQSVEAEEQQGSDEDPASTQDSSDSQRQSQDLLIRYLRGILNNMESMAIERMHSMLRMMSAASTSGGSGDEWRFEMNIVQFRRFLQTLVDTDVIEMSGDGVCRLSRSSSTSR